MPSAPGHIDSTRASIARVYDRFLGGKDNFTVDREVYEQIVQIAPEAPALARAGRHFLTRAITYLATEAGIDQFLDLGCGLPTADNTHEVATRANPDAVTVYVDNDPTVAAHGRALLASDPHTYFTVADLRDPSAVLNHHTVAGALDFQRPLALIQAGTLHHLEDHDQPAQIMRTYTAALPPGSYVVLTSFHNPAGDSASAVLADEIERRFRHSSMGTSRFRTLDEIQSFLPGLELLPSSPAPDAPAIVPVEDWWPTGPRLRTPRPIDKLFVAALAYKPGSPAQPPLP
ncbi:SAM-dependent methyltransferase [Saccharopolyspora endophytica]|uniref:SAM-dependent methyltransferase n=1 Tax=Saccharopolyspora endophytica TaxID=543886 RepID=A0ABS5DKC1_9PSEU|nr:SAM-dependent methyltransferase [Saccharopolyspora endophytica]MBQ0926736.1 SAM-dependent methyltransferase [Saccharopolyspora endophytica]